MNQPVLETRNYRDIAYLMVACLTPIDAIQLGTYLCTECDVMLPLPWFYVLPCYITQIIGVLLYCYTRTKLLSKKEAIYLE